MTMVNSGWKGLIETKYARTVAWVWLGGNEARQSRSCQANRLRLKPVWNAVPARRRRHKYNSRIPVYQERWRYPCNFELPCTCRTSVKVLNELNYQHFTCRFMKLHDPWALHNTELCHNLFNQRSSSDWA